MNTVAIVGRPNVGKSALFNRLAGKEISLVHDQPGVTRDRMITSCRHEGHRFELIDTGGIGLGDKEGFAEAIAAEVEVALASAENIIMVVDGREGVTPLDQEIARKLRRSTGGQGARRILLAVNKLDVDALDERADEFHRLGFENVLPISAAHGRGIEALLEAVTAGWPEEAEAPEGEKRASPLRLAFLGRPNVGKSSLVNALLRDKRTLVSEIAGTTRDSVDIPFTWKRIPFTLIDTAGMRQRRKVSDPLEVKMTGRSAHTINRANVCVLVLEATAGVQMQDKKIGGLIADAHRPCLVVLNKWDVIQEQGDAGRKREFEFLNALKYDLFFLEYAPVLFTSAKSGERVEHIMRAVEKIEKNRRTRIPTAALNDLLQKAQERYAPPTVANRRFKIYYATHQLDDDSPHPVPTLLCFVNSRKLLVPAYQRYLELKLREKFPLEGCPIRWIWREKETLDDETKTSKIVGKQSGTAEHTRKPSFKPRHEKAARSKSRD